jgi:CheY-like chemotaxis protein/LmbE family N-acetylglucosaminyl deacetylase
MSEGESGRARVLLVEDNLSDATLIRTWLEREDDIRVTLAQDGIRGCELVGSQRWDLVVTDFNLPGRDGIEVIRASKAHQPDTPVLATSAYAEQSVRDGAYRGGANEVLAKPIDAEELVATVRELLRLRTPPTGGRRQILAVGILPGDVEAGCGGSLLRHARSGDAIGLLVLSVGVQGSDGEEVREAARLASHDLGATLFLPPEDAREPVDLNTMVVRLQGTVREMAPNLVLAPSPRDVRESRRNAFRATELATSGTQSLLCYQAATTTLDFRPTHFEDISEFLVGKMGALSRYQAQISGRPHLDPSLAAATARYWGRFLGYSEVEPFEVVRQNL